MISYRFGLFFQSGAGEKSKQAAAESPAKAAKTSIAEEADKPAKSTTETGNERLTIRVSIGRQVWCARGVLVSDGGVTNVGVMLLRVH